MIKDKIVISYVREKCIDLKARARQVDINWEDLYQISKENLILIARFLKPKGKQLFNFSIFFLKTSRLLSFGLIYYLISWMPFQKLNRNCSRFFCQYFLDFLGVEVKIINHGLSDAINKGCVIITNHPSVVEGFVFPLIFKNLYALVSKSALRTEFFYRIFSASGHIIMDKSERGLRRQALFKISNLLYANNNVVICPEGKCSSVIGNHFYKGAFELAMSHKVPIVSLYCHYHNPDFLSDLEAAPLKLLKRLISQEKHLLTINIHEEVYLPENIDPKLIAEEFRKQYLIWQAEANH